MTQISRRSTKSFTSTFEPSFLKVATLVDVIAQRLPIERRLLENLNNQKDLIDNLIGLIGEQESAVGHILESSDLEQGITQEIAQKATIAVNLHSVIYPDSLDEMQLHIELANPHVLMGGLKAIIERLSKEDISLSDNLKKELMELIEQLKVE